jgi:hypothetical protein
VGELAFVALATVNLLVRVLRFVYTVTYNVSPACHVCHACIAYARRKEEEKHTPAEETHFD